jgi:hypothetical protein
MNSVYDSKTKERLLTAATKVFAERGFKETTVREICALAGANLAEARTNCTAPFWEIFSLQRSRVSP